MTEDEKELVLADRRSLIDAIFQLTKWLIATLFLLNGAAAVATLNNPALDPTISAVAAMFFVKGLMSSLGAAITFLLGLGLAYLRIMHMLRAWSRSVLISIMAAQIVAGFWTLGSMSLSVASFVSGVKMLATVSMEDTKKRLTNIPPRTPAGRSADK